MRIFAVSRPIFGRIARIWTFFISTECEDANSAIAFAIRVYGFPEMSIKTFPTKKLPLKTNLGDGMFD